MANVLVMEDDETIRYLIVRVLQLHGHTPLAYADAGPALSEVDFSGVDLIVTDLSMPTPGEEAIRRIRSRGVNTPILVVSGSLDPKRTAHLFALGVQEKLDKPFKLQDFIDLVDKWT